MAGPGSSPVGEAVASELGVAASGISGWAGGAGWVTGAGPYLESSEEEGLTRSTSRKISKPRAMRLADQINPRPINTTASFAAKRAPRSKKKPTPMIGHTSKETPSPTHAHAGEEPASCRRRTVMLTEGTTSAMDTSKTTKEKGPKPMSATNEQIEYEGDELSDTGEDHYGEDEEPELRAGGTGREDVPVAQAEVDGVHERVT